MASQGLLFSEPAIAETCVWCELSEGINPAEWANLCRHIGTLTQRISNVFESKSCPNLILPEKGRKTQTLQRIFP